jgi:hypothetical protein
MTEEIYNDMLKKFSGTLEETSKDDNNSEYMTSCQREVVSFDRFKIDFMNKLSITDKEKFCKSCDALYMAAPQKEFFMIEFKNGDFKNKDIRIKMLESLLLLSEKSSGISNFAQDNLYFILVYNEAVRYKNAGVKNVSKHVDKQANEHEILFGLSRFKGLYFKDVFTYSKAEFESEFVSKRCKESELA